MPAKGRGIVTSGATSTRRRHAHGRIRIDHDGTRDRARASSAVGATAWRARPMTGRRRDPPRLRRRRNRWRVHRRICLGTCLTGKDAGLVPAAVASSGSGCQHGRNQTGFDQVQPGEETAIPSELRTVHDVGTHRFRGHAASITRSPPIAGGRTTPRDDWSAATFPRSAASTFIKS